VEVKQLTNVPDKSTFVDFFERLKLFKQSHENDKSQYEVLSDNREIRLTHI